MIEIQTKEELDNIFKKKNVVLFTMPNLPSIAMRNIFIDVCNILSCLPYSVNCMAAEFFDSLAEYDITVAPTIILGEDYYIRKAVGPITRKVLTQFIKS